MTETDDDVMKHLLHICSAIDEMRQDMRELRRPLGGLENRYLSMSCQLDHIDSRIERIERHLDLTDA
jgi:hypothetical protein